MTHVPRKNEGGEPSARCDRAPPQHPEEKGQRTRPTPQPRRIGGRLARPRRPRAESLSSPPSGAPSNAVKPQRRVARPDRSGLRARGGELSAAARFIADLFLFLLFLPPQPPPPARNTLPLRLGVSATWNQPKRPPNRAPLVSF